MEQRGLGVGIPGLPLYLRRQEGTMLFICYPRCTTCKRAESFLTERGADFDKRDIKTENPTEEELRLWHKRSGLPLKKFFNTSGLKYKELELSRRLKDMSEEEQFMLLASDGMLVKRPLLITGDRVLVGFSEREYEEI